MRRIAVPPDVFSTGASHIKRRVHSRMFSSNDRCVVEAAVTFAAERLRAGKFSDDVAQALQLALLEAVGNVVRHAAGRACEFSIAVTRDVDTAVIEVVDYGPGFELHLVQMPEPFAEGGRGLPLMQRLCDSVEYRTASDGNRLVLKKRIAPRAIGG
jgi:serine/threonine-protein kinase RsbW